MQTAARTAQLAALVARANAAQTLQDLGALYLDLSGVCNPLTDLDYAPTATVDDMRDMCHDYIREVCAAEGIHCAAVFPPEPRTVAALYIETAGAYTNVPAVDPWDEPRDARTYAGPHPVVAHPPCQRWGRFWHGSTARPHQYQLGADGGCFAAALASLRAWGGVLEHPMDSHAWDAFGLAKPPRAGGWVLASTGPELWTCCVYQGHYGHPAGKGTWLLAAHIPRDALPALRWGKTEQRIHPRALELHGYEKARRIGMLAMMGGKEKTRLRNATPPEFRDLLLSIARLANPTT